MVKHVLFQQNGRGTRLAAVVTRVGWHMRGVRVLDVVHDGRLVGKLAPA